MIKNILKIGTLSLLAVSILALPVITSAQDTNAPAAEKKSKKKSTPTGHPFHGNLAAVDKTEKTVTVGKSVYQVTSETKISKAGKPATLEDGVIGEECGGYAKTNSVGKVVATTLRFGPKTDAEKKSGKSEKSDSSTK